MVWTEIEGSAKKFEWPSRWRIPAPLASADTTDDAVAGDSVSDAIARQTELAILNGEITTLDDDLGLKFLATPDVQLTDSFVGRLPGGAGGTEAVGIETFLVNDFYNPLIDFVGGAAG